jgi:hypothetical protein
MTGKVFGNGFRAVFRVVIRAVFGAVLRESPSLLKLPGCYQPLWLAAENEHGC